MHITAPVRSTGFWIAVKHPSGPSAAHIGRIFAWTAVIIYAASNSILSLLVSIGEAAPVAGGRNAITYTNLLLLGSLLSILPMAIMFRRDLTRVKFMRMTRRNWSLLALSALLSSAITPGLFFYALAHTSVTNVVLISRIEPPLFLLATWLILNERFNRRAMAAGLVALSGAVVMISMREGAGLNALGTGEWATVGATLSYIASTLVTRKSLRDIPIGLFSVARTILGAVIYFALVCLIVGPDAFQDIFAPVLWSWIWLYAGIFIVLAQVAWNMALKYARSDALTLATSSSPLAAILIAMALLGETPGSGFVPGAVLILFSIVLSSKAKTRKDALIRTIWRAILKPLKLTSARAVLGVSVNSMTGLLRYARRHPRNASRCRIVHSASAFGYATP